MSACADDKSKRKRHRSRSRRRRRRDNGSADAAREPRRTAPTETVAPVEGPWLPAAQSLPGSIPFDVGPRPASQRDLQRSVLNYICASPEFGPFPVSAVALNAGLRRAFVKAGFSRSDLAMLRGPATAAAILGISRELRSVDSSAAMVLDETGLDDVLILEADPAKISCARSLLASGAVVTKNPAKVSSADPRLGIVVPNGRDQPVSSTAGGRTPRKVTDGSPKDRHADAAANAQAELDALLADSSSDADAPTIPVQAWTPPVKAQNALTGFAKTHGSRSPDGSSPDGSTRANRGQQLRQVRVPPEDDVPPGDWHQSGRLQTEVPSFSSTRCPAYGSSATVAACLPRRGAEHSVHSAPPFQVEADGKPQNFGDFMELATRAAAVFAGDALSSARGESRNDVTQRQSQHRNFSLPSGSDVQQSPQFSSPSAGRPNVEGAPSEWATNSVWGSPSELGTPSSIQWLPSPSGRRGSGELPPAPTYIQGHSIYQGVLPYVDPQDGRSERARSRSRSPKKNGPEKLHGDSWEAPRPKTGLKLLGETSPVAERWRYPVVDESRRSYVGYLPAVFTSDQVTLFYNRVSQGTDWKQPLNSRGDPIPRKTSWMVTRGCSCSYGYGGIEVAPQEYPIWMLEIMQVAMPLCGLPQPMEWPNACNLNYYQDGGMSVGWHSDDERLFQGKFTDCRILSLSLGAVRKFELRVNWPEKADDQTVYKLPLGSGDILTMEGMVQKHFQHRVPKEGGITEPRINLTWRWVMMHSPKCPAGRSR